jgi:hypothetical protein
LSTQLSYFHFLLAGCSTTWLSTNKQTNTRHRVQTFRIQLN